MRAVLQRASSASVEVAGEIVGSISLGWVVLLGVGKGDGDADVQWMADKVINLRGFSDDEGKMNKSVADVGGSLLVVSQFTLLGDCRTGRRPGFTDAADPETAVRLYESFVAKAKSAGVTVATGVFRADMKVSIVNDGPVTFLLDSMKTF